MEFVYFGIGMIVGVVVALCAIGVMIKSEKGVIGRALK